MCMSLSLLVIVCSALFSASAFNFALLRLGFFPLPNAAVSAPLDNAESADDSTIKAWSSCFAADKQ